MQRMKWLSGVVVLSCWSVALAVDWPGVALLQRNPVLPGPQTQMLGSTCATATEIPATSTILITLSGTTASPVTFPCKSGGAGAGYAPQWFRFVATDGFIMADTCGFYTGVGDTLLGIWGGTCTALENVACNDDACGDTGYLSQLQAGGLTVGSTYYVQVAKWAAADADGTYTLSLVNCVGPATVTCETGDYMEWELDPGGPEPGDLAWTWGIYGTNNGCDRPDLIPVKNAEGAGAAQGVRGFAGLACGVTVCGSVVMWPAPDGVLYRDLDYYKFYIPVATPAQPVTVTWDVAATFAADAWLVQPGPGPDPCAAPVILDAQAGDICNPNVVCTAAITSPGEYWAVVAPSFAQAWGGVLEAPALYRATLNALPNCDEPTGACCIDAPVPCAVMSRDACVATGGHYWGDGASCDAVACWACPAGAVAEAEGTCTSAPPYMWYGEQNDGCLHVPEPAFQDLGTALPVTVCGTSTTYLNANPPSANLRDNDWYKYGTNANWPINVIKGVTVTVRAEFPVEVSICPATSCDSGDPKAVATAYGGPGEQVTVSNCVKASTSTVAQYGRVWVVVRPALYGNPLDIPCGERYWLTFNVDDCTDAGACCKTTGTTMGGCVVTTAADCFATAGAVFYGQNTTCDDANVCCPCATTNTNENEVACAFPDNDSGCFITVGPYAGRAKPITPGTQTYCGSNAWVAVSGGYLPDADCYYFSVTETADIRFNVHATFEFDAYLFRLAVGHGTDVCYTNPSNPYDPTAMRMWSLGLDNASCVHWTGVAPGMPPGTYQVCLRTSREDGHGAICNVGDHPRYQASVDLSILGACCVNGDCHITTPVGCEQMNGHWMGAGTVCDPNPCCALDCIDTEHEPDCGLPTDNVNGGCNSTPPRFGMQLAHCPGSVCGTGMLDLNLGLRDTDWYLYHHAGGDVVFTVTAEFAPLILVLNADCGNLTGWRAIVPVPYHCQPIGMEFVGANALPAGDYYLFVAPDFDLSEGAVPCGTKYTAELSGCAPVICPGDSNCDGSVNFSDIDLFVAAIPDAEGAWAALFQARYGHAPTCPFLNNDVNGDGHVNFADIDPFVALIPSACP